MTFDICEPVDVKNECFTIVFCDNVKNYAGDNEQ